MTNYEHYIQPLMKKEEKIPADFCSIYQKYVLPLYHCDCNNVPCALCSKWIEQWHNEEYDNHKQIDINGTELQYGDIVAVWDKNSNHRFIRVFMFKGDEYYYTLPDGHTLRDYKANKTIKTMDLVKRDNAIFVARLDKDIMEVDDDEF